jgi:hypothetical protein
MFLPRIARQHAEAATRKPALSQELELRASLAGAGRQSAGGTQEGGGSPTHSPVSLSLGAVPRSFRKPSSVEHSRMSLLTYADV